MKILENFRQKDSIRQERTVEPKNGISNSLRAALLGFSVLVASSPFISCNSRNPKPEAGQTVADRKAEPDADNKKAAKNKPSEPVSEPDPLSIAFKFTSFNYIQEAPAELNSLSEYAQSKVVLRLAALARNDALGYYKESGKEMDLEGLAFIMENPDTSLSRGPYNRYNASFVLQKIAIHSEYENVRTAAVAELASLGEAFSLREVARFCAYQDTQIKAVQSIPSANKNTLVWLATDLYSDSEVQMAAVKELEGDTAALAKIAEGGGGYDAMQSASDILASKIDELDDVQALKCVALHSNDKSAALTAVEKLEDDNDALKLIAIHARYEDVSLAAVKKLGGDVKALVEIAEESWPTRTTKVAVNMLASKLHKLTNPDALACIAVFSQNEKARLAALEKLAGNEKELKYIAKHSKYEDTKNKANEMLKKQ
ncbi:hypothetical protein H0O02_01985 [Candidatus Micrarchaeota archaeon]|nr:hypothetical protein [Candidatus Micrarchaeota archaeon]